MRVVFAGTPEFAVPALRALHAHHQVAGVLTQPDRPVGRGRRLTAGAVKRATLELGLPLEQPASLKDAAALEVLRHWQPRALVVVAYGMILPPPILALPPLGCLNIHASLLPRWRGAAPIQRAILAGDTHTGVAIMQMESGLDTGPVLLSRTLAIGPTQTAGTLAAELAELGAQALLEVMAALEAGTARAVPQRPEGVTYAAKLNKSEARIDWSASAEEIGRQVRALNPWPVAETRLEGEQLRIYRARVASAGIEGEVSRNLALIGTNLGGNRVDPPGKSPDAGLITMTAAREPSVQCGAGSLILEEVQRPGRRPVTGAELASSLPLSGLRLG
ncbi:MAG: methionyl-tRNA formyltransferase [Proteobacteria bacterium]|nr:methionyl-tRNA formyltransferase [Pseudomonadota bacterium]